MVRLKLGWVVTMTIYAVILSQNVHFTGASIKKNSLTKVVKEYALIQEMSWKPLTMEIFSHKMFIFSQPY